MHRTLAVAIALALAGLAFSPPLRADAGAQVTTQLPRDVRPRHYEISFEPHADQLSFDGKTTIHLEVLRPTDRIVLQAMDMRFSSAGMLSADGKTSFPAPKIEIDAANQTASFVFPQALPAGSHRLVLSYTGKIGTQANGLFAIDYTTKTGDKRALYTQFENSDARRFVPSWDEPNYKATFALEAVVPSAQMAVSNMPVAQSVELGDGRKRVRFATSPKMSTYLLFFGLGDFERATVKLGDTEVGVVTQTGLLDQARFALDSSDDVLGEYNEYFAIPYPLPKLDNIASPGRSQFFGAMENWGAIYTFEYALLLDPTISTQADRQRVFSIAAHEIAHQWFGNLVTMQWWDDLWLNEGFATWMAARTTKKLHPEWNTTLKIVGDREEAMALDAGAGTHPVVQHVETVEQASQAFDDITYLKGGAVIGMLENYVGADAWREGVRSYMQKHAYGNTASDDLWREVQAAAGKPVLDIAHDFTLQPGVPLIRVEDATCANGMTQLRVTQGEFTKDGSVRSSAWRVPLIAQSPGGEPVRTLVEGGAATLQVPGCGAIVINAGQTGYYRSLYSPAQFGKIRDGFAALAPIDQLGLLGDTWALGMAGYQSGADFMDLAQATPADADPQIWGDIAGAFSGLDDYYRGDKARQEAFRAFARAKLAPVFARVGWEARAGESDPTAILRTTLIGVLSDLGDTAVIGEAKRRYAADGGDPKAMPAALRKTILAVVAQHADVAGWEKLRASAAAEKTPLVRDQMYELLATADDEALAHRALDLALTDEPGETNSAGMIAVVAQRFPELAFEYATGHRAQVDKRVDSTSRAAYYPELANTSLDPGMVDRLRAYADAHIAAGSRRAMETVIANIEYRRQVKAKRLPEIDAWLQRARNLP